MIRIRLTEPEREELKRLRETATGSLSARVQMVLLADQGLRVRQIAEAQQCSRETVQTWLRRWQQGGVAGLEDLPHGRPPR